ncbi:MAG: orotate phosphoribosyltransferase [Desulfobacterales bacterium S3730MH5]|nr:MAG: orotate phosphoribosyltransferase [Desulfobacterales bacterium S3730MH5]
MKQELVKMLYEKSFMYSQEPIYKLVSGRMSHFYVNCKPTTLDPKGMFLVGHLTFTCMKGLDAHGVGGLTFGADPVAMATAFTSYLKGKPVKAFSIRKTQKDHGIVKWIEGDMKPGERVVIVEDVVTTGGSAIKAVERARAEGLDVVKVVVLVDRQEGGMEAVKALGTSVESIVTIEDLMAVHRVYT